MLPVTGDDVRHATFRARFRGYDPQAVDAALQLLAGRIDSGQLSAADLEGLHFGRSLRGYDPDDVDQLVDKLRAGAEDA